MDKTTLNKLEKEAEAQALKELEASPEVIKLRQKIARDQDKLKRMMKEGSAKARKERNHRLIFLGANVEKFWGGPIVEGSKEMECLLHYLPIIKREFLNGNYDKQLAKKKEQEE